MRCIPIIALLVAMTAYAADPEVTLHSAQQLPGTKTVEIVYDATDPDGDELDVTITALDGDTVLATFAGLAGANQTKEWYAGDTWSNKIGSLTFKVTANDNQSTGISYQLISGSYTWHEAKADAESRGGHLATFTSQEEWSFMLNEVGSAIDTGVWWIGATDEVQEGRWEWVTGENWSFSNWDSGEPNNALNEDHLVTWGVENSHRWNDYRLHDLAPDDPSVLGYILELDGLVAYYPFDGNHGTVNGATLTTGVSGQAYLFDRSDNRIGLNAKLITQRMQSTLSVWIYPNSSMAGSYPAAIYVEQNSTEHSKYKLHFHDGKWGFFTRTSATAGVNEKTLGGLAINQWHHVVVVKNGLQLSFYANGVNQGALTLPNQIYDDVSVSKTFIGYQTSNVYTHFAGKIDQVRIYDRALSSSEIQQLYQSGQ